MISTREVLEEVSDASRIGWQTLARLVIVGCCIFGVAFGTLHEDSFESNVTTRLNSQRCGDRIYFFFNDRTGKNIDPENFKLITIIDDVDPDRGYHLTSERRSMKGFSAPTRCGLRWLKVLIAYQNEEMVLILKRIPGDHGNIFLYSIPFSKGTFVFDFEDNLDKTCEDDVKGWHGECIILPKRMKNTASDCSKQGHNQ